MDYRQIFEISATGMDFQRLRLETIASNLANVNNTQRINGEVYQPLVAVARSSTSQDFDRLLGMSDLRGVEDVQVLQRHVQPRLVKDPGHPDADSDGFVHMPAVNPVDEMTTLMTATRTYEANVRVLNAAKMMALKALDIGNQ